MTKSALFISLLFLVIACQPAEKKDSHLKEDPMGENIFYPLRIRHAQKLKIDYNDKIARVTISEPFKGAMEGNIHYLVPRTIELPDTLKGKSVIRTPVKRFVCTSTTHLPALDMLDVTDRLLGFPSLYLVSSEKVNERAKKGQIVDLGKDYALNTELILDLSPEVIMTYTLDGNYKHLKSVERLGANIVLNADYLENTPLGRAEWIKFFGILFGKEKQADSVFQRIETEYNNVASKIRSVKESGPTSFCGINYKGVWYMPGGNSWMGKFLKDAHSDYLWSENDDTGSLELSFEGVYDIAEKADVWINAHTFRSLQELGDSDERYKAFEAYQNKAVFNSNARMTDAGGNDYYESGFSRPDIVLKDLAKIFHPERFPEHQLYYFQQLN